DRRGDSPDGNELVGLHAASINLLRAPSARHWLYYEARGHASELNSFQSLAEIGELCKRFGDSSRDTLGKRFGDSSRDTLAQSSQRTANLAKTVCLLFIPQRNHRIDSCRAT